MLVDRLGPLLASCQVARPANDVMDGRLATLWSSHRKRCATRPSVRAMGGIKYCDIHASVCRPSFPQWTRCPWDGSRLLGRESAALNGRWGQYHGDIISR